MSRIRIPSSVFLAWLVLVSCATVKPPQRPVAYIYPSLVPMATIKTYRPMQLDEATVKRFLEESRTLATLEKAGLRQSELSILVRGLAKHGYAELDARRSKSEISWLTISCYGNNAVVRAVFRKRPSDFNRFGIPTHNMTESTVQGYYGETKRISSATKDNVTLLHVKSGNSSTWELYIGLTVK
ncbi:MAG: hypothetical protein IJS15_07595 [Victivallales bacterium]|nr:hypothetical protein [Victivallales bacterium]